MIPVKRLEIVIEAPRSQAIIDLLSRHSLRGWTRIRGASGFGDRGLRLDDELTGVASNVVFVTTCEPDALDALLADLQPLLARHGGMCLVSDAHWLQH